MKSTETIRISRELRARLKALGLKGESYDAVIRRLMKEAEG